MEGTKYAGNRKSPILRRSSSVPNLFGAMVNSSSTGHNNLVMTADNSESEDSLELGSSNVLLPSRKQIVNQDVNGSFFKVYFVKIAIPALSNCVKTKKIPAMTKVKDLISQLNNKLPPMAKCDHYHLFLSNGRKLNDNITIEECKLAHMVILG
jgi:hypothetical protein